MATSSLILVIVAGRLQVDVHARVSARVSLHVESRRQPAVAERDVQPGRGEVLRLEAVMRLRFPSVHKLEEEQPSKKRERGNPPSAMQVDSPPPIGEDVDMDHEIEPAKRIKWDEFATTYWQLHDSISPLSSPDLQEAFLDRLTEGDLKHETSAL